MTVAHGHSVANEVGRLLKEKLTPIRGEFAARRVELRLPFDKPPTREEIQQDIAKGQKPKANTGEKNRGDLATAALAALDRGESPLPTNLDYGVTTWTFGADLAMVFLPGEVVVDYALRLKRELDGSRLWVTAYTNDVPCYIPSRRVLAEGGYEADNSMVYYGKLARLSPDIEDQIINTVKSLLSQTFVNHTPK